MSCQVTHIYTLSHPLTGEVGYVGKSDNPKTRLYGHINEYAIGEKKDWINAIKELGLNPVVEILDTVERSKWTFWESHYISLLKSWGFSLFNKSSKCSEDRKQNISNANKKAFSDPGVRAKISERLKGRKLSDETKEKLSRINSGDGHPFFGKHLSEEHRDKIRKTHTGRTYSPETIERMRNAVRPEITQEAKAKMSKYLIGNKRRLGKPHLAEIRKIISEKSKLSWAKRKEAACQTV